MYKRVLSMLLAVCMLFTMSATAFASPRTLSSDYDFDAITGNHSVMEMDLSNGVTVKYDVWETADSVITVSVEGNRCTVAEAVYRTGELIQRVYEDGVLISEESVVNESVRLANEVGYQQLSPLALDEQYVDIGNVLFKTNDAGVAFDVSIREKAENWGRHIRYDLNAKETLSVQLLTTSLLAYLSPLAFIMEKSLMVSGIVKFLNNTGIMILAENAMIKAFTADYVDVNYTEYAVDFENQYGAGDTAVGTALHVISEGDRYDTVLYDNFYPQFLKERDRDVAAMMYFHFSGDTFPGVKTWNATRTVDYYKGQN